MGLAYQAIQAADNIYRPNTDIIKNTDRKIIRGFDFMTFKMLIKKMQNTVPTTSS